MASQMGLKSFRITLTAANRDSLSATNKDIKVAFIEIHNLTGNSAVYVGDDSVDSNWIPIAAAATKSYSASENSSSTTGDYFNLKEMYVAGTTGDIIVIQYLEAER